MVSISSYRNLSDFEISALKSQGCKAADWRNVFVSPDFDSAYCQEATFSGHVCLGAFRAEHTCPGGVRLHSGVYRAHLHNVTVGNDCLISNVGQYIANYDIEPSARIADIGLLAVEGATAFGNGTRVSVLLETGGREVPIYDGLTAQIAYLLAMHRYRTAETASIEATISAFVTSRTASRGRIGAYSVLTGVRRMLNVRVGEWAVIADVERLTEGTVCSTKVAPTKIGAGVMADHFIVGTDSTLSDGASLCRCYVGQGCTIGHRFTASDSLFFCNSQMENGEACALLAGPFSVSHHKSSLLIGGVCSFMNVGSGSNQSNHAYKLGPNKYGVLERGTRLASGAYLYWPMRVGAFSTVLGRHGSHSDLRDLPFSYVIGQGEKTFVVPAVGLRSIGLARDVQKWPQRDGRAAQERQDCLTLDLLNPWIADRMMQGQILLKRLLAASEDECLSFGACSMTRKAALRGLDLYDKTVQYYLYGMVVSRLDRGESLCATEAGSDEWVDYAGLIAPQHEVEQALAQWQQQPDLMALNDLFRQCQDRYETWSWNRVACVLRSDYDWDLSAASTDDLIHMAKQWAELSRTFIQAQIDDADKEFDEVARSLYGVDGELSDAVAEFEAIQGCRQDHEFIKSLNRRLMAEQAQAERVITRLQPYNG